VTLATTESPDMASLREEQSRLRSQLADLRRRLRLQLALETALDVAAGLAATGAVLVALDWWFRLGRPARLVLLAIAGLALLAFIGIRAFRRWRAARLDDLSLAMTLDRFRPGTGGRIADVLQLPGLLDEPADSTSPALVRLAVRRASDALAASDWSSLWNRRRTGWRGTSLVGALLVPLLFAALLPAVARLSAARWLLGSNERWPQRTYLTITGLGARDSLLAPRDEPFAVEVRADLPSVEARAGRWIVAGRGEPLALRSKPTASASPPTVRLRERAADGTVRDALMVATGPSTFRHELPPASGSSTFELIGGDDWLGPVKVERVDRPALAGVKLRARDPGSPAEAPLRDVADDRQHPVFLPDTEIELTLTGDQPIAEARLTVHPGEPPGLARGGDRTFSGRWTLREATTLEVQLVSSVTGLTSKPTFLSLGLLKDRVPRVTLRAIGVGAHVTPVATIPLSLAATDDLGLAAVRLQADRVTAEDDKAEPKTARQTIPMPLAADGPRAVLDHQARHDIELQTEPPAIGTILRFVAEADDRCARGVQGGRSGGLQMQVVSPDELFYEILIRQRAERSKFIAALEATEKQAPSLAGEVPAESATAVLRSLHTTTRQLEQIAARIGDTLQEMKLNQVGSPKSHRLLQEGVIDPIQALVAGPIPELRGVLQSLSGHARKPGADAESARKLHADVVAQMKVILDQMSQWESFVDVVNQVAEVIKLQQGVLQATEKARETRTEEVFDDK
jgi:hypothetical protein